MKKLISIALTIVMVFGIIACAPVSASAAYVYAPGDYRYDSDSYFYFEAPYNGWYAFESYDNLDPYLYVQYEDGSEDTFDDSEDSLEFDAFIYLYEGEEIYCGLGTYEDDEYINFIIDPIYDVETNREYTIASGSYFSFTADHNDYYQIYSFDNSGSDPYIEFETSDGDYYEYDDEDGYEFYGEIYLEEGEDIFGIIKDYDGYDINFYISCDCGNYGDDYFEVGYTYSNVDSGTEFVFTAPYTGYFIFESYGENDPCFEYLYDEMFYFSYDDNDYDAGDFDFYAPVYLYAVEQIVCRVSDWDDEDNICFEISYGGTCEHHSKDWYIYSDATVYEPGCDCYVCEDCFYIFDYEITDQLNPETPKAAAANGVGGITVSWNEVEGAVKYNVYRRAAGSSSWVYVGTTEGTSLFDRNVSNNKYYAYSVRAYNSAGGYSPYVAAKTYTIKCVATPKLTKIQNATSGIRIDWTSVPSATGYRVYRRGAGSTYWYYLGTTKNLWYVDGAVKNQSGNYYRYTVRAVNSYYSGFDTNGLFIKRLSNPVMSSAVSSQSGITVKWGSVRGSLGYYVYRKTANSNWTRIAVVNGVNNTAYLDRSAVKGVTYTYTVKAVCGSYISSYYSTISCKDKY
ncbi:MAG: hypothetical protein J6D06_05685 [Clostridia bacterium]|nr:hypothetical protein [Clostridia bacterium]